MLVSYSGVIGVKANLMKGKLKHNTIMKSIFSYSGTVHVIWTG